MDCTQKFLWTLVILDSWQSTRDCPFYRLCTKTEILTSAFLCVWPYHFCIWISSHGGAHPLQSQEEEKCVNHPEGFQM